MELSIIQIMTPKDRKEFWEAVESGSQPLLSVLHTLVEKWGLPAIIMCLGDIAVVLSEDAVDAENITPNQRGLIIGACAQVSALSDQISAEMNFISTHNG
tara:strand:- start:1148 stop:1447 length:300 start_codon:yes stop_codon:yes gene_type:complete